MMRGIAISLTRAVWGVSMTSMAIGILHTMAHIGVRRIGADIMAGMTRGTIPGMDLIMPAGMAAGIRHGTMATMDGVGPTMVGEAAGIPVITMPTADRQVRAIIPTAVDASMEATARLGMATPPKGVSAVAAPIRAGRETQMATVEHSATIHSATIATSISSLRGSLPTTTADSVAIAARLAEAAVSAVAVARLAVARLAAVAVVAVDLAVAGNCSILTAPTYIVYIYLTS